VRVYVCVLYVCSSVWECEWLCVRVCMRACVRQHRCGPTDLVALPDQTWLPSPWWPAGGVAGLLQGLPGGEAEHHGPRGPGQPLCVHDGWVGGWLVRLTVDPHDPRREGWQSGPCGQTGMQLVALPGWCMVRAWTCCAPQAPTYQSCILMLVFGTRRPLHPFNRREARPLDPLLHHFTAAPHTACLCAPRLRLAHLLTLLHSACLLPLLHSVGLAAAGVMTSVLKCRYGQLSAQAWCWLKM